MSEVTGGYLLLQNNVPNLYPKLLHPVHDNHKILIAILKVKNPISSKPSRKYIVAPFFLFF